MDNLEQIDVRQLTEDQRIKARQKAREQIVARYGKMPVREDFLQHGYSEYPAWLVKLSALMLLIVLMAGAGMSSYRVGRAGYDNFSEAVNSKGLAVIAGISTALLAEFTIITSTMVGQILLKDKKLRRLLIIPISLGVLVTITGNAYITLPHLKNVALTDVRAVWAILETIAPPVVNIVAAWLLKHLALASIADRRASELAYLGALDQWRQATSDPESMSGWIEAYGRALRDAIIRANARGRKAAEKRAALQGLSRESWIELVSRELEADRWFSDLADPDKIRTNSGRRTRRTRPTSRTAVQPYMPDTFDQPYSRTSRASRTPYTSDTQEIVYKFLSDNPDLVHAPIRRLAELMGRPHSTISPYVKAYRDNGNNAETEKEQ